MKFFNFFLEKFIDGKGSYPRRIQFISQLVVLSQELTYILNYLKGSDILPVYNLSI